MASTEPPCKRSKWVWHTSAGLIHHPDIHCADCAARQLHVSNAEVTDEDFKAGVTARRADRREIERLKGILGQRDEEIEKLREEVRALRAEAEDGMVEMRGREDGRAAETQYAYRADQRLPTPPSPFLRTAGSSTASTSCEYDSRQSDPRRQPGMYPPSPAYPHPYAEERVFVPATRDPRLSPSVSVPLPTPERETRDTPPHLNTNTNANASKKTRNQRKRSRSVSVPRPRKQPPPQDGVSRSGARITFRRVLGSLTPLQDFAAHNPTEYRLLPEVYIQHRIFTPDDVEDLFERQCHPNNCMSKKSCTLLDDLYTQAMVQGKSSRSRTRVENYVVQHYGTNRAYSEWFKGGPQSS
ncbi:hypothetical protein EIP91_005468 [Steccherinum ochraceum]|uniref:Uncharacterized protein n=1 Tax=Steccherinum ochraceum TaxID=92696 RepID=A0A4R0RWN7_9APHY|nr:hypothetical protein EIP91_005468 [Steccherinum ochraceum]